MATKAASRTVATAMAIASRSSRACDVCASKSARWYCGADAAYLCDRCDTQVHTANSLAQRHERVRLSPAGVPVTQLPRKSPPESTASKNKKPTAATTKKPGNRSPPPQVLPARKRTRTSRPHPHRRNEASQLEDVVDVKVELSEANLFADFFDTEDFLIDHPQEVPSLIIDLPSPPSSEYSPSTSGLSPGSSCCFSPESFHGVSSPASEDSFAAYFKGKAAALEDDVMSSDHQFGLVPDAGIDIICCDADGNISLAGDACFVPGDIPGLEAFDDCSLSFDLALRGASEAFEGDTSAAAGGNNLALKITAQNVVDQYANGPFAKYFVTKKPKSTTSTSQRLSPEIIKLEAREILRCCTEGEPQAVPSLRLNYEEIIAAWSDRGEPWVSSSESCNATDVGLVPDMGLPPEVGADDRVDDGSSGREARVLRYKEKRRSRLFSKTIRYEVRKLNAERRPRMKGRFVRRTNTGIS